jgi:hypothetical protein
MTTAAYGWCRWGPGEWGFSPMIQLGRTSLLVYWVHIELVYGKFAILPHRSQSVFGASAGLLGIFISMLALSLLRTKLRGRLDRLVFWRHNGVQSTPISSGLAKMQEFPAESAASAISSWPQG